MGNGWRKWTAALAACLMLVMSSGCYVVKLVEVWGGTTLTSEDGGYSLTLTAGWADAAGMLNDYAVLEAAMTSRERYVMVIPYDKEDAREASLEPAVSLAMEVTAPEPPDVLRGFMAMGDRTLEDVTELLIAEIADGSQDGVVSGRAAVQIDGRSGYTAQVDGTVEGLAFTYWISCMETDGQFVEIVGWTLADMAADNKEDIQTVMHSLQVS